ncbi:MULTISPECIES: hypothetical protein [unclassified Streptomyces]|uniref:hypothetical protein n=1 Tax=unclassified Streptomyces TaxID=2593676 RepID=UPI00224F545E|nr:MULTISPECIES: hypothetical protein [unclassified Streptomyces]MCX5439809.1 hypothetical protein [Streptomyces sp. NBC_00063]WSE17348.1 hypothetical protein OG518_30630 [Streptomyces sp. NBC_01397]WUB93759.1 hypothetical protein OHO83_16410 [Streptomyces sp. NBC_00569]
MYEYEIHQVRAAELIHRAEHSRLVREAREARRSRRAERRAASAGQDAEGRVNSPRSGRSRFARAA